MSYGAPGRSDGVPVSAHCDADGAFVATVTTKDGRGYRICGVVRKSRAGLPVDAMTRGRWEVSEEVEKLVAWLRATGQIGNECR